MPPTIKLQSINRAVLAAALVGGGWKIKAIFHLECTKV
jgi:hypothetical protein